MTYEEAVAQRKLWTYGYAKNARFLELWTRAKMKDRRGFCFQYDLEIFFFLHYEEFPTDIKRSEHLWRAVAIRWPETQVDGRPEGAFLRNPWAEEEFDAISESRLVNLMGGSGQGKTTGLIAFGVMLWDYFLMTSDGARFIITSVTESKLKGAAWSTLEKLYRETATGISATAGMGKIQELKIKRPPPYNKDDRGIIQGILLAQGNRADGGKSLIDKLTGQHVSTCTIIMIDEVQSTPDAPIKASYNLFTRPKYWWQFLAGNPHDPADTLGTRYAPKDGGWDTVDPKKIINPKTRWVSCDENGREAITIRFDNDNSPYFKNPTRYYYLPNASVLASQYPTVESRNTADYWRFWRGYFVPAGIDQTVITLADIEENGGHLHPKNYDKEVIKAAMAFDSAPASLDRSPLLHFQLVREFNGTYVLYFPEVYFFPKSARDDYWPHICKGIIETGRKWRIPPHSIISDESGNNTQLRGTLLAIYNYRSMGLVYNEVATDKSIDHVLRQNGRDIVTNKISEAAILFRNFIRYGQVRGLNPGFCDNLQKELCTRKFLVKPSGKLFLEPKGYFNDTDRNRIQGFKGRMGFSPDVFDVICQAAWYAREVWGLYPGMNIIHEKLLEKKAEGRSIMGASIMNR